MNCKKCFRCGDTYPSDDLTPDAFGDSSVCMCGFCLSELKTDNSKYLLVETPEHYGTTFVLKQELDRLHKEYGENNITILNNAIDMEFGIFLERMNEKVLTLKFIKPVNLNNDSFSQQVVEDCKLRHITHKYIGKQNNSENLKELEFKLEEAVKAYANNQGLDYKDYLEMTYLNTKDKGGSQ